MQNLNTKQYSRQVNTNPQFVLLFSQKDIAENQTFFFGLGCELTNEDNQLDQQNQKFFLEEGNISRRGQF